MYTRHPIAGRRRLWAPNLSNFTAKRYEALSEFRSGRRPQLYLFCDSAKRCALRRAHARNREAAEAAVVRGLPDRAAAASGDPEEACRAPRAVFPIQAAVDPASPIQAEDDLGARHTIRASLRGHGPCNSVRSDRLYRRAYRGLFHVPFLGLERQPHHSLSNKTPAPHRASTSLISSSSPFPGQVSISVATKAATRNSTVPRACPNGTLLLRGGNSGASPGGTDFCLPAMHRGGAL